MRVTQHGSAGEHGEAPTKPLEYTTTKAAGVGSKYKKGMDKDGKIYPGQSIGIKRCKWNNTNAEYDASMATARINTNETLEWARTRGRAKTRVTASKTKVSKSSTLTWARARRTMQQATRRNEEPRSYHLGHIRESTGTWLETDKCLQLYFGDIKLRSR